MFAFNLLDFALTGELDDLTGLCDAFELPWDCALTEESLGVDLCLTFSAKLYDACDHSVPESSKSSVYIVIADPPRLSSSSVLTIPVLP